MFGDERASAKEISLFLVSLQCQGSAVSETTKLDAHVRPNLNTIGQAVPEIQKRGVHVRTCRDTPPMKCVKHVVHDPQLTHQN